jgi:cytochrome subunit of sulfide dehydrogenase
MTGRFQLLSALSVSFGLAVSVAVAADGAQLADACSSCHGLEGRGGHSIPPLAGMPEDQLLSRLKELSQPTDQATIMPRLLRGYDSDELAALAAFFAGVAP